MDLHERLPLPVEVAKEDLEKNPKFSKLLSILRGKILSRGVSVKAYNELESIKQSREKYNWFTHHVPYYTLRELWSDMLVKGQSNSLTSDETKLKNVLSEMLAHKEIENCLSLQPLPNSKTTLFGLTTEDVQRYNPVKQHLSALQGVLVPMLEEKMIKKCEKVYSFFQASQDDSPESVDTELKCYALTQMIEERQVQLDKEIDAVKKIQEKKRAYSWLYYQKLLECLSILGTHLEDVKMSSQAKSDHVFTEYLSCQCDAVRLKFRVLQMQILCITYTTTTVKALEQISSHLDKALKETAEELISTERILQSYRGLGPEFQSLSSEYTNLTKEIENRVWGLKKLGQPQSSEMDNSAVNAVGSGDGAMGVSLGVDMGDDTLSGLHGEEGAVGGHF